MSWLSGLFKPRQDNFTRLLVEQAVWVVKGLDALSVYVSNSDTRKDEASTVQTKESGLKVADGKASSAKTAGAKAGDAKIADPKSGDAMSVDGRTGSAKAGDHEAGAIKSADPTTGKVKAAELVRQCEQEADEVRRILISELNRTFVTPFDREDISALSRSIDDIIDYAWSTVQEMELLHVTPTPHLQRMVSLLHEAAREVHLAMLRLREHPGVATEHAQRAKALENRVETVYREALADLFNGPAGPKRVINILKMREVYRHLSNAADRGDAAANIISDIVVKMT